MILHCRYEICNALPIARYSEKPLEDRVRDVEFVVEGLVIATEISIFTIKYIGNCVKKYSTYPLVVLFSDLLTRHQPFLCH